MSIRYISLCSGIEAASVAWRPLGWEPVAVAEIDAFPSAVLRHHYPDVPNLGDMTKIDGVHYNGTVDLMVAGTPCQDFSVAGRRAGLAGTHSRLALDFIRLVHDVRPRWIVWENVPGAFSTGRRRDFGTFLGALVNLGYSCAWRVLDAQFFGVPQRRRRIYLVGHLGDWRPAAAVLFEPESLRGNTAPRGKTRADVAATIKDGSGSRGWENGAECTYIPSITQTLTGCLGSGGADDNRAQGGFYIPDIVHQAMSCKWSKGTSGPAGDEHHNLVCAPLTTRPFADNAAKEANLVGTQYGGKANALTAEGADASPCADRGPTILAFTERGRVQGRTLEWQTGKAYCLTNPGSGGRTHSRSLLDAAQRVRRLTPLECERLQGFPDYYTEIEFCGKPASDSLRYKALGNAMAVPVMRWIGQRIAATK